MQHASLAAHVLAGVLALVIPLTGPIERRIYQTDPKTPLKLAVYGVNVAALWVLAIAAVCISGWRVLFESLAVGDEWLWAPAVFKPVLNVAMISYFVVALLPLIQGLRGPRWRRAYAAAYRRGLADVPGLLPKTSTERSAWVVLSFTAGICEETLCRGFLIRYLHSGGFSMPLAIALLASSMIFGAAHAYQGLKGVIGTAISGLGFGLIFLLSGSLLASIVLHVLVDLQVAFVLRPIPDEPSVAALAG